MDAKMKLAIFDFDGTIYPRDTLPFLCFQKKVNALLEAIPAEKIDFQESYAYADSYSDLKLLELAGNPVAVEPKKRLGEIAREKNWKVIVSDNSLRKLEQGRN